MSAFVHAERCSGTDHLVNRIPELDLDLIPFARHPHIRTAQLPQKIKRRLGLLSQRKPKRVLLASLPGGLLDVLGQPVETVRRACTPDALMRPLMIVKGNPMGNPLARVREGSKQSLLQKLLPDCLPEPLDLAQGHRMTGGTAHVADPLALQDLLEPRLPPPGCKLAAVVRQNLPRGSPLPYGSLDHLQDSLGCLLPEEPVPHDVARVIVNDPHQVDRVEPLELEGK
jgi:hypothetical protein